MRSLLVSLLVPILGLTAVACSANVVPAGADANTSSMHALLVVEQSTPVDSSDTARSHASMWFLRTSDEPSASVEAVTRLVTDQTELPTLGTCVAPASRRADRIDATLSPVELAFAGDVFVDSGNAQVQLAVRAFPDVANLVSGVMYTAPGPTDLGPLAGSALAVRTTGADGIPALSALADAPSIPREVHLEGMALDAPELEAHRGHPLTVTWAAGSPGDLMYVDIDPVPGSASERVRCALADTGSGQIAAMAIPETSAMSLSVHRVRIAPLRSGSGEVGTAQFDIAISGKVKIAAP